MHVVGFLVSASSHACQVTRLTATRPGKYVGLLCGGDVRCVRVRYCPGMESEGGAAVWGPAGPASRCTLEANAASRYFCHPVSLLHVEVSRSCVVVSRSVASGLGRQLSVCRTDQGPRPRCPSHGDTLLYLIRFLFYGVEFWSTESRRVTRTVYTIHLELYRLQGLDISSVT